MARRILFVCMGNICRSPTAEAVFASLAQRAGLSSGFEIDSAGTHDYHVGNPPDSRAIAAAERRGHRMAHLRARQVSAGDFQRFDVLLAMDEQNLSRLQALAPREYRARAKLFLDIAPELGRAVPDPYYGDEADFERALDLIESAAERWLKEWTR